MTICEPCAAVVPAGKFCGQCGEPFHRHEETPMLKCPACQTWAATKFCPECGERLVSDAMLEIGSDVEKARQMIAEAQARASAEREAQPAQPDDDPENPDNWGHE
jgi:predicted  nucleic acid-binding Zn-ribbon protein